MAKAAEAKAKGEGKATKAKGKAKGEGNLHGPVGQRVARAPERVLRL